MSICNKLEGSPLAFLSSQVSCLQVRLEPTRVEHRKGAPLGSCQIDDYGSENDTSLLYYSNDDHTKMIYSTGHNGQCNKTFFGVIYATIGATSFKILIKYVYSGVYYIGKGFIAFII
jgi:hypothetical protein